MTAPDPRLGEIEGRAAEFRPCTEGCCGATECQTERDTLYLLAELRKAQEHLIEFAKTAPEDVAESLTESGGDFLHKGRLIRAAVADATEGERG